MADASDELPVPDESPDSADCENGDDCSGNTDTPDAQEEEPAYTGTIRVHVTTAEGARPVPGASVVITRLTGSEQTLIAVRNTDDSGEISPVEVPAPPPSADQRNPASFAYDITVLAPGYYREHSADMPVFPYITSVQNFDLIPLPAGAEEPLPDGDITFYNNMQRY